MTESSLRLDVLCLEDFGGRVGTSFELSEGGGGLVLREAKAVGQGHPGRAVPFSLMFDGALENPLEQGVHALDVEGLGRLELFIVPVGTTATARQYEAIFN